LITLLGNGDGTFQSPLYLHLPSGINANSAFIIQDVNLDGKLDLVFDNGLLLLGNGDGTFSLGPPVFSVTCPPCFYGGFDLVQMDLAGSPVPSLVFLANTSAQQPVGVFTPQTSSSAALPLSTLAVGTHSITARYSGDANYSADTSPAVTVTVNQAVSATAVTSSVNPSFAGQSVTLTAKVTSNGPTPTGNVTFTSGSTTLATVALSGGSAAYTTTSFDKPATLTITASYSGDADTQASSSATLSQVVNAAFSMEPGGNGSTTLTVQPGQTVSAPINVTGVAGFSGPVTFACSGLPANASCSFSPATITLSGTAVVPTLLTINTAASATTAQLKQDGDGRMRTVAYGLGFASLIMLWPIRRRRAACLWAMMICAVTFTTLGLTGCNGSGSNTPPETTAGSYNFTVTASSGKVQAQSSYTLVVQ
jgi:Bacterial Ig-like domain (group 3)